MLLFTDTELFRDGKFSEYSLILLNEDMVKIRQNTVQFLKLLLLLPKDLLVLTSDEQISPGLLLSVVLLMTLLQFLYWYCFRTSGRTFVSCFLQRSSCK